MEAVGCAPEVELLGDGYEVSEVTKFHDVQIPRGLAGGIWELAVFVAPAIRFGISGCPYLHGGGNCDDLPMSAVLVVDDDAGFRQLAVRLLERAGLRVAGEADTVRRAMETVLDLRVGAVLLDVSLPDGDGVTLASELTQLPWQPRVVLISSDPDATKGDGLVRSGAVAFIPKSELTDAALRKAFAAP
jgi:CheY-like chemotaxis protein